MTMVMDAPTFELDEDLADELKHACGLQQDGARDLAHVTSLAQCSRRWFATGPTQLGRWPELVLAGLARRVREPDDLFPEVRFVVTDEGFARLAAYLRDRACEHCARRGCGLGEAPVPAAFEGRCPGCSEALVFYRDCPACEVVCSSCNFRLDDWRDEQRAEDELTLFEEARA